MSPAWRHAAVELQQKFETDPGAGNCASVAVEAREGGVRLTFQTRDGRTVQRQIQDPVELIPTVESLSTEAPLPSARLPTGPVPALAPAPAHALPAAPPSDVPRAPYAINPVYGAELGVRAGADHLISPCIGPFGAIPVGPWELGILARYEGHYVSTLGGNEGAPKTASLAFGVTAGRRIPIAMFVLRAGVLGVLAAVHEDHYAAVDRDRAEGRLGGFVGSVWPAHTTVRLRADLAFEVVPYSIGHSETNATGAYSLPWWGVASTVGVELQ
ncbi:MAG TPA: hypothetical protein VGI10_20740 [Polyangiaceae bacterium]